VHTVGFRVTCSCLATRLCICFAVVPACRRLVTVSLYPFALRTGRLPISRKLTQPWTGIEADHQIHKQVTLRPSQVSCVRLRNQCASPLPQPGLGLFTGSGRRRHRLCARLKSAALIACTPRICERALARTNLYMDREMRELLHQALKLFSLSYRYRGFDSAT